MARITTTTQKKNTMMPGMGIPRYSSRSSHGRQSPTAVRFIRLVHRLPGTKRGRP